MSPPNLWTIVGALLIVVYFSTWLLIPWILLKRSVHPSASVAWIMAVIFIPFLGPLLCALTGVTRWERRTPQKQLASAIIDSLTPDVQDEFLIPERELGEWAALGRMTSGLVGAKVTAGNKIKVLPDTKRTAEVIEQLVEEAQEWVHVEFYIWNRDKFGTRLRDLLVSKARQGVEVRLLYDGIGSMWINKEFLKPLRAAGVSTAPFNPGHRLTSLLTLNLRNHRKLVICDGQVGLTGGMNIGDEYLHPTVGYGHWRDTQIRVAGPAVLQFQKVFARDWYYATGEALTDKKYYPSPALPGDVPAAVVADGPDDEVDAFYSMFVAAIGMARDRVTLATPYFVPPEGLAMAIETAAWRGVRVRIIVANRGNFLWTLKAGQSYYQSLLQAGVEIYEYQRGIYHAKTLTVDGQWSMIGTPNCDFRSFVLNFEVAVSMFDEHVAQQLEEQFEADLRYAQRIDAKSWRDRRRTTKLHERFWRLFAPLF